MLANLKAIRLSHNLSQEKLASMIGISQQAIQKYEAGTSEPDLENLKRLAASLNCSVDYLIGYNGSTDSFSIGLSDREKELLVDLRKLSSYDRKAIEQIVSQLAKAK
jgi:transcriptional regulator with XRE-family HTH domain